MERTSNRFQHYLRIATRDEQLAAPYLAMRTITCILEWLSLCRQTLAELRRGLMAEVAAQRFQMHEAL